MLTQQQIENRKNGIGASESATVLGLNRYMSPYELWMIKTGKMEPKEISHLPQVHWGNLHEEPIAQEYARITNCKVRRVSKTLYHKNYPFMLCHLDRKVKGENKLLECKFSKFGGEEWGEPGSDVVPASYIIQVQHQLAITEYPEADLAVLIGGCDFRIYHFKPDPELIDKIIQELSEFWACVKTDTPPLFRDRGDVELAYPFSNGKYKQPNPNIINTVYKINQLKNKQKILEEERIKLENDLTSFIAESDGIATEEAVLATWKANKRGSRVLRIN